MILSRFGGYGNRVVAFLPDLSILVSVFHGEKYLASFFENLQAQTVFPRCEIILVLNEPSQNEKQITEEFALAQEHVHVVLVEHVETLGASWNRAWQLSRAPYLSLWNVDDRRTSESLDRQVATLDQNEELVLCYGDYVSVDSYGEEKGELRRTPPYSPRYFRRAFAQGGAFWVFRRSAADKAGFFDEQFQVAADMDFSFRLASRGLLMGRVDTLLGYFTDEQRGLSTRDNARWSMIERCAIQLRYGVFDKVDPQFKSEANKYRLDEVKSFGQWHSLREYLPHLNRELRSRRPLHFLGVIRNSLRRFFERIGLLGWLHRSQTRWWKREI